MGIQTGLWIDHRKAVIVAVMDQGETVKQIISKVEKQLRRAGDSPLKGPFEGRHIPADDSHERKYTAHLNMYYDAVVASLRNTEGILIFGPGEAKVELKKRLEKDHLGGHILGLETADKMTEHQIMAKVHAYFHGERHTSRAIRTKRPGGVVETHRPVLPKREKIEENN
jgi:hypothetical protein